MGVEYSSTKTRISNRKTLAADSYYMVHSTLVRFYIILSTAEGKMGKIEITFLKVAKAFL